MDKIKKLMTIFVFCMIVLLSCLFQMLFLSVKPALKNHPSIGNVSLASITDYENTYGYGFKSLNIWIKQNGLIVIKDGKWQYTNENVYSAYENFIKPMLEDIILGLSQEDLNKMDLYIQSKNVETTYNQLKNQVDVIKNAISQEGLLDAANNIIIEGLIAKSQIVDQYISAIDTLTVEQKADISDLYEGLIDCKDTIITLNDAISTFKTNISAFFVDGDMTKEIITDGLLAKESNFDNLDTQYNLFTVEQKSLLLEYDKISEIKDALTELKNKKQQFTDDFQSLSSSIAALNADDGILSYEQDIISAIENYEQFTVELKNAFSSEKQSLDDYKSICDGQKDEIDSLIMQYVSFESKYPTSSDYSGLISDIAKLQQLKSDMQDSTMLNLSQITMLKPYVNAIDTLCSKGETKKQKVDDYILQYQNSTLYTKYKYKDGEIDKMYSIIQEISELNAEQQQLLENVKSGILADIANSEGLLEYVQKLFSDCATLGIWSKPPIYGFGGEISIQKIHEMQLTTINNLKLYKGRMFVTLTQEQETDILDLRDNIVNAEIMYDEFISLHAYYSRYNDLTLDNENVLISKKDSVKKLYAEIINLQENLSRHLQQISTNLENYIAIIDKYETQIALMQNIIVYIKRFDDNILGLEKEFTEFANYYNGLQNFPQGNRITQEQKQLLSSEYAEFQNLKDKYNTLKNELDVLKGRFVSLNLNDSNKNLIDSKNSIQKLVADMTVSTLTFEQKDILKQYINVCNEYLSKIAVYELQVQEVKRMAADYLLSQKIINNHDIIYNLLDDISNMPACVKESLKDIESNLQSIYDKGTLQLSEINKIIEDIKKYNRNGIDSAILYYDSIIENINWIKNTATEEQKLYLTEQIAVLNVIFEYSHAQMNDISLLEDKVDLLSQNILLSEFQYVASLMKTYDSFTVFQVQIMDEANKQRLISIYNNLRSQSLTNSDIGVQIIVFDDIDRDYLLTIDSLEIDRENTLFESYNKAVFESKIGTELLNLYSINLKLDNVNYSLKSDAEIRIKLPASFKQGSSKILLLAENNEIIEIDYTIVDENIVFLTDKVGMFAIVSTDPAFPTALVVSLVLAIFLVTFIIYFILHKLYKARIKLEYDDNSVRVTILWPAKDIKNIALYVNGKLSFIDKNPISVYYVQNVDVGDKITIFYDFLSYETQFPEYLQNKSSLKCTSKKIAL